jgi:predicted permease
MLAFLRSIPFRLKALFQRERFEDQMDEELRAHIERQIEENERAGMSYDEARRAAALAFGSVDSLKEECRESWGVHFVDTLMQDLRVGVRGLVRNPGYAAVVILTLGLGIGANSAIFSVVNGVMLRPLPYAHESRIVALRQELPQVGPGDIGFSVPEVDDIRRMSKTVDAISEFHSMTFTLLGGEEPLRVRTAVVSSSFFDLLGVLPEHGRLFRPEDEGHGAEPVLLLTHAYWQQKFGGDPAVVGRSFQMNDRPHQVVGILPPLPDFPNQNDVYMPATACPFRSSPGTVDNRNARLLTAAARLKPGVTPQEAQQELTGLMAGLAKEYPDAYPPDSHPKVGVDPVSEVMVQGARPTFLVLLATVGLVLLIACANVANLALARLSDRGKEMAVRAALGASRGRLLRQLLTESTLLALAGGVLGLLLAVALRGALTQFAARFTARAADIHLDSSVLLFTLGISLFAGVLFGTLPGLPSAESLARAATSDDGRLTASRARQRVRSALVVAQVALSFTLVIGAALMLRSFSKLAAVNPGFVVENVVTVRMDLNWTTFRTEEHNVDLARVLPVLDTLHERLQALPGVSATGNAWTFPLNSQFRNDGTILIEGQDQTGTLPLAEQIGTSPDYFKALSVPLLEGRSLTAADRGEGSDAVVVNDALARTYLKDGPRVGRRISYDRGKTWRTIVGVVGDIRQAGLSEEPRPTTYLPFAQFPGYSSTLIVRTTGDPTALTGALRTIFRELAPDTALGPPRTLEQIRHESLASPRLTATLLGLFAFLALAIAAAGLSGVLAYTVSQRTREIGLRVAMGAAPGDVVGLVLRQGLTPLVAGLGIGIVASLGLSQLVSRLLFGVQPTDPLCFIGSLAVLLSVGVLACLVPARRAVAVEPMQALRAS